MAENLKDLLEQLQAIEKSKELDVTEQMREAMLNYQGEDEVISFQDWLKLNKDKPRPLFKTALSPLDSLIDGFSEGDLITITAPTGQGKTSFCAYLTNAFSQQNIKTLWFCYENTVASLIAKFGDDLPKGYLPQILTNRNLVWIEKKIIEAICKFGIKTVFIDHLHYLVDMNSRQNMSLVIGEIVRHLKIMAKKYKITIFLVAHTGKVYEDEVVSLESIRDSSFVGQESDYVIALWRGKLKQTKFEKLERGVQFTNETTISVVKNRKNGNLGSFKTIFSNHKYLLEANPSLQEIAKTL